MRTATAPLAFAILAGIASIARAQPPNGTHLRSTVDALARPCIDQEKTVGLVVGVVTPEGRHVFGYGRVAAGSERAPDGETIFEIGSITKVLTGLCLAQMVEEGAVALDDPLEQHLPPAVTLRNEPGRKVTLKHLATHTSGLPRIPLAIAFHDPRDPYAKFNEELLVHTLNSFDWPADAGTKVAYSNLGAGTLGWLLARRAGTSYEELVVQRICEPLGLGDTRITLDDEQKQRLAPGHTTTGDPSGNWRFDVLAGAGAFYSTANDLLRFAAASLPAPGKPTEPTESTERTEPTEPPVPRALAAALARSRQPHAEAGEPGTCVGLGWMITRPAAGPPIVWHNGATGAYASFLGLVPERGFAVVVLTNTRVSERESVPDEIGFGLLRRLCAGAKPDAQARPMREEARSDR